MRKATVCAVLAALAAAGCSAGHASSGPGPSASIGLTPLSIPAGTSLPSTGPAASASALAASVAAGNGQSTAGPANTAGSPGATAKPVTVDGNITIAAAGNRQPGPLTITPLYCGKLSATQQRQFGTTAAGGLIYRYANTSATATGGPNLYVGFTDGSAQAGANYGGPLPELAPGQSAEGEVDAVGITNQDLSFTGCEIMSYALDTSSGVDPVSYAG